MLCSLMYSKSLPVHSKSWWLETNRGERGHMDIGAGTVTFRVSSKEGAGGEASPPKQLNSPPPKKKKKTDPTSPPPLPPQDIAIMNSTLPSTWLYGHVIHELPPPPPPKMKFLDETLTLYAWEGRGVGKGEGVNCT